MIIRNKIWEFIKEADINYRCAIKYASVQRQISFCYKVITPLLAALCALFTKLEMPNYSFISAIIIFISSILKIFCTQIILSEKDIDNLDNLGVNFEKYRTTFEKLLEESDNGDLTDKEVLKTLNKNNIDYCKKKSELNKLVLWIPSWVNKKLQEESEKYLLRVYHNKYS